MARVFAPLVKTEKRKTRKTLGEDKRDYSISVHEQSSREQKSTQER